MKLFTLLAGAVATWTTLMQPVLATDGTFCSRLDGGGGAVNWFYAVQTESTQRADDGYCNGLWANLRGISSCAIGANWRGCEDRGTRVVNGETLHVTWWWFSTTVFCKQDSPPYVADVATVKDLNWRYGVGCQWRKVERPAPELLLDDTKWL